MLNLQELRAQLISDNKKRRDSELKDARDNFAARTALDEVLRIVAACDVGGLKADDWKNGWRVFPSWRGWSVNVDLTVEGFLESHDERLAKLLSGIQAALPVAGQEWSSYDSPEYKTRRFSIRGVTTEVTVTAELKEESTKCRQVLVGKKLVEKDLYEFRCDGEEVS